MAASRVCAACDRELPPTSQRGQTLPLCFDCGNEWQKSMERARASTARGDFVARRRKELGK